MIRNVIVVAALAFATACSGSSTGTPEVVAPSSASPTPTLEAALTQAQAAAAYLQAVKPSNAAQKALVAKAAQEPLDLSAVKKLAGKLADEIRIFSTFLAETKWPATVVESARAARVAVADQISALRLMASADSEEEAGEAYSTFADAARASGGEIDLLRQDLGLPSAS